MVSKKILLVEDDPNLGFVIKDNLAINSYDVDLCADGEAGLTSFKKNAFDLCILDIMLPRMDGLTLAQNIRNKNQNVPIIFLTAKSLSEDKIAGFKLGADDYITKPFSMEELICRMEVFLKRSNSQVKSKHNWRLGEYIFDYLDISLNHHDEIQKLTRREADLLLFLCENQNAVTKREDILLKIWGDDDYFKGRSLDVFISRLRKYLSNDPKVDIVNYHGVGFKLEVKK